MVANVHEIISTAGYHISRCINLAMRICWSDEGPAVVPSGAPPSMLAENLRTTVQTTRDHEIGNAYYARDSL